MVQSEQHVIYRLMAGGGRGRHTMEEMLCPLLGVCFEWIFLILAGKKYNYKSLNGFEFRPHPITDYRVSCP